MTLSDRETSFLFFGPGRFYDITCFFTYFHTYYHSSGCVKLGIRNGSPQGKSPPQCREIGKKYEKTTLWRVSIFPYFLSNLCLKEIYLHQYAELFIKFLKHKLLNFNFIFVYSYSIIFYYFSYSTMITLFNSIGSVLN